MALIPKKILGIDVTISPKKEILEEIRKYLKKIKNQKSKIKNKEVKPLIIFTPNPEIISYAQKDDVFKRIVNTAQINLPDGTGIVWAVKKISGVRIDRIAGADFMTELVNLARRKSLTIGLIGGKGDLAVATRECLRKNHPGLKVAVFDEPEVEILKIKNIRSKIQIKNQKENSTQDYFEKLTADLSAKQINILFVALGFPKQEYFIQKLKDQISKIKYDRPLILMAVGGSFEYISGRIRRAPILMQKLGLEWLCRLVTEPWRLGRQIRGAEFFWKVLTS